MRPRPAIAAIVFDLDGTLVDSRGDLAAAVDAVRRDLGLAPLAPGAIEAMVGEGARLLVERALGGERGPEAIEPALAAFFGHYDRLCLRTTRAFPGVGEALSALASLRPLAVLTNKPERFAVRILAALDLARHFQLVVGGDTLPVRKPDPATLRHVAEQLRLPPSACLLVGDSRIDAETAARAGAPFVHVRWGYGREEAADEARAIAAVEQSTELASILAERLAPADRPGATSAPPREVRPRVAGSRRVD